MMLNSNVFCSQQKIVIFHDDNTTLVIFEYLKKTSGSEIRMLKINHTSLIITIKGITSRIYLINAIYYSSVVVKAISTGTYYTATLEIPRT